MSDPTAPLTVEGARFVAPGGGLAYVPELPPPAGGCVVLRPGLRWLRMPLPMVLNHINIWLLEMADGWVLIDTGMATADTRRIWIERASELLDGKPLRLIVVTHFHPDHAGLVGWLQRRHDVPVWMSRDTYRALEEFSSEDPASAAAASRAYFIAHGIENPAELELMSAFGERRREMVDPALPRVERFLEDGDTVRWNGNDWNVYATDGHALGHLCFECTGEDSSGAFGWCVAGDQILPTISPNVSLNAAARDPDPLRSYLASLDRLAALPERLVLPSHGIPFVGLAIRAAALKAHHDVQLEKLLLACAREGRSAVELLAVMYRRPLGAIDKVLGLGETVAHLEYLVARRQLERRVDAEQRITYGV
jgi:glyoxylase-like metal-dependent hydrolase (beta-lactamase superfamily II)